MRAGRRLPGLECGMESLSASAGLRSSAWARFPRPGPSAVIRLGVYTLPSLQIPRLRENQTRLLRCIRQAQSPL